MYGQKKHLSGKIVDSQTGEELIGVNVVVKNSTKGTSTDLDGKFELSLKKVKKRDTLEVSYIGYETKQYLIKTLPKFLLVKLKEEENTLTEIILTPDFSQEELLMDQVIENKKKNNPENTQNIKLLETEKTSVLLSNIDEETKKHKRYKNSQGAFIKNKKKGTYMLPIMFTEELYDYQKTDGDETRKLIKKDKKTVLENTDGFISDVVGNKVADNLNFYHNLVYIFDKAFPSPVSSSWKLHYEMYITDSTKNDDSSTSYKMEYYPKNRMNPVFEGEFWINNKTYAIENITAVIPVSANVNFIHDYSVAYSYAQNKAKKWFLSNINTYATLSISKDQESRKFQMQKEVSFQEPREKGAPLNILSTNNKKLEHLLSRDTLISAANQDQVLAGITSLKDNQYFKTIDRLAGMTISGYYEANKIDIGPYFDMFYRNAIEDVRINVPIRTSKNFSENFSIGGYLGYGTRDKEFKWGGNFALLLSKEKRSVLKIKYKDDYTDLARNPFLEFIQENPYSQGGGNVLSMLQFNNFNEYLLREKYLGIDLSREFNPYFKILMRTKLRRFSGNPFNPIRKAGKNLDYLDNRSVMFDFRYSKDTDFDQQFFNRLYFGGVKPVYHFISEIGNTKLPDGSTANYAHLNASFKKVFYLETIKFQTYFDVGKIFGKVPYNLMYNPQSLQGFAAGRYVYNLLDNYSLSATTYSNLHINMNGGGVLFNKIPLLRKLKIREAASFKMFYGQLDQNANAVIDAHPNLNKPQNEPYMEIGIGVSNIFKVLRLEYVTRLNKGPFYKQLGRRSALKLRIEVSF
jgi:hypothetical protein